MPTASPLFDAPMRPRPVRGTTALLGEAPWWDARRQRLWWVDIQGQTLHLLENLEHGDASSWPLPGEPGFAIPTDDGHLIIGIEDRLYQAAEDDPAALEELAILPHHDPECRINEAKTDRAGRLWFGTMHRTEQRPAGILYRLGENGLSSIRGAIVTSNGIAFAPDDSAMYFTDSMTRTVYRHSYSLDTGVLGPPVGLVLDPLDWVPDGLTVDAEGGLWSAKWDGGRVIHYRADGTPLLDLRIPARRPTSCVFGGPRLDTLIISSAQGGPSTHPRGTNEGSLFTVRPGVRGLPETPVSSRFIAALRGGLPTAR